MWTAGESLLYSPSKRPGSVNYANKLVGGGVGGVVGVGRGLGGGGGGAHTGEQ